ncbi:MAG: glycosyltransferase family 2 protein [Muribaculaceae bacterium]|nr:glycosyltransferase family 2 protein [Muribaculaceae bacterium]
MLSIIVPIYNAENYLQATIDSVFSQSYTDWELILVDDGSTDHSPDICELARRRSERVRVVNMENAGVSTARNTGLKIARGSHIMFLDADDLLPPDALSIMTECAAMHDSDIVCGAIKEVKADYEILPLSVNSTPKEKPSISYTHYTPLSAAEQILYQKSIDCSAWGKIYKASLWSHLRFREGIRYEDLDLIPRLFTMAERITRVSRVVYLYRQHPRSYIHTFSLRRADVLDVTERLSEWMMEREPSLGRAARARELNANFNILALIAANKNSLGKEEGENNKFKAMLLSDRCWNKIKELRGEALRNPSVRLKTKIAILISYFIGRKFMELLSRKIYR